MKSSRIHQKATTVIVYGVIVPNHYQQFDVPEDIAEAILIKLGQDGENFLRTTSAWYGAKVIRETIKNGDNLALMRTVNQLRGSNQRAVNKTESEWAHAAYERSPAYFEKFLKHTLRNKDVIREILPLARDHEQLDLYQHLYSKVATQDEWHQAVTDILLQNKSAGETLYELDWISIANHNIKLTDDLASQLYQKHPVMFQEFIRRHVRVSYTNGFDYPQLKTAILANNDDFWWAIFREVVTAPLWKDSLQELLEDDVPADCIVDELEKRHPTKIKPPTSALQPFLKKYGEALLPYLEKHVKMLTEKRLKQLLALDIDRAELKRELENLSRRQPVDFQQMIHIWLPALYDSNSDFWDTLILRNLSWSLPENHGLENLIKQMEFDGKNRLFSTLYRMTNDQASWNKDMIQLANCDLSDDEILVVLKRRRLWWRLNDKAASALYQRNPNKFREYIMSRLPTGYNNQHLNYKQITQLAETNQDHILIQKLNQHDPATPLQAFKALEDDTITVEEVLENLQTNRNNLRRSSDFAEKLMQLFEHFGEPMLDYMLKNRWWWSQYIDRAIERFTNKLESLYDRNTDAAYWQAFFSLSDMKAWNQELRDLVETVDDDDIVFQRLELMLPQNHNVRLRYWQLDEDVAYNLARRDKNRAYPLIRAITVNYSQQLFNLAIEMNDTDLIDTIIYRVLVNLRKETPQSTIDYIENLLKEHPEQFVRRAGNILSHISAFEIYRRATFLQHPLYKIFVRPRELWLQSPSAISDLLESPSIYLIYMALELLAEKGELSAERTHENLFWIRSFLLGRAKRNTKSLALDALINAAKHGYAQAVFKVLEAVKDFQGKRAIDDKILVAYGRLLYHMREGERA